MTTKVKKNKKLDKKQSKKSGELIIPNAVCRHVIIHYMRFRNYSPNEFDDGEQGGALDHEDYSVAISGMNNYYLEKLYDDDVPPGYAGNNPHREYFMSFWMNARFSPKSLTSVLFINILVGGDEQNLKFFPLKELNLSFECLLEFDLETITQAMKMYLVAQSFSIAWPVARELAADILRKAGYYPAMLPLVDPFAVYSSGLIRVTK